MERLFLEKELLTSATFVDARNHVFGENFQIVHLSDMFRDVNEVNSWALAVKQRAQDVISTLDEHDRLVLLKDIEFVANELQYIRKRLQGGN